MQTEEFVIASSLEAFEVDNWNITMKVDGVKIEFMLKVSPDLNAS
jgi:hypothetical protein